MTKEEVIAYFDECNTGVEVLDLLEDLYDQMQMSKEATQETEDIAF